MIAGIATAIGFLLLALWAILRAGATLPIRQFFTFCAYTVLVLAVIFTGKGVVALQESGLIAQTSVNNLPTVSVLGVYPTTPKHRSAGGRAAAYRSRGSGRQRRARAT